MWRAGLTQTFETFHGDLRERWRVLFDQEVRSAQAGDLADVHAYWLRGTQGAFFVAVDPLSACTAAAAGAPAADVAARTRGAGCVSCGVVGWGFQSVQRVRGLVVINTAKGGKYVASTLLLQEV